MASQFGKPAKRRTQYDDQNFDLSKQKTPAPFSDHQMGDAVANLAHAALGVLAGKALNAHNTAPKVSEHCLRAFCSLLVAGKLKPALNFARLFMSRGANYGDVAEDLFANAARRLGDRWEKGKNTTIQVNIGILTLTRAHIALSAKNKEPRATVEASALFGSFPGQSHTLGLAFSAEYFYRNGWNVHYLPGTTISSFMATAAEEMPEIIGMTAALDSDIGMLQDVIERVRELPSKPRIIVGGHAAKLADLDADAIVTRLDMGLLAALNLLKQKLVPPSRHGLKSVD